MRLRPSALALYSARSALFKSRSGSAPSAGANAMPMLTVATIVCSPSFIGAITAADETAREIFRLFLVVDSGLDDDEFVAAEPGRYIVGAGYRTQTLGDGLEQKIAAIVTEGIVDLFETIEIDEMHGDSAAPYRQDGQRAFQFLDQPAAIGQTGQCIVTRHVGNLRLSLPRFGDVLRGRDPAAFFMGCSVTRSDRPAEVSMILGLDFPSRASAITRAKNSCGSLGNSPAVPWLEQIEQRPALEPGVRHFHPFGVTFVIQHDATVRVEHAKPLGHVVQRGINMDICVPQFDRRLGQTCLTFGKRGFGSEKSMKLLSSKFAVETQRKSMRATFRCQLASLASAKSRGPQIRYRDVDD